MFFNFINHFKDIVCAHIKIKDETFKQTIIEQIFQIKSKFEAYCFLYITQGYTTLHGCYILLLFNLFPDFLGTDLPLLIIIRFKIHQMILSDLPTQLLYQTNMFENWLIINKSINSPSLCCTHCISISTFHNLKDSSCVQHGKKSRSFFPYEISRAELYILFLTELQNPNTWCLCSSFRNLKFIVVNILTDIHFSD